MRPSDRSFLDTNIFVYTFDAKSPRKRAIALEIVGDGIKNRQAVVSYQVVQEFLNVATRKFAVPMQVSEAQLYLREVLMPLCEIFPDEALYRQAVYVANELGISFYDALIVSSAQVAGCSFLLSEDLQHGRKIGSLEIRNPFL